jgi:aspartate kinase
MLDDLNDIVDIINIYVKENKKVICVLSAFKNYTDVLISKYKEDKYVVLGELISVSLLRINLEVKNLKTIILDARMIPIECNNNFSDADIVNLNIDTILNRLEEYDVVLIPGFQGIYNNEYYTLGRDGSDYTAIYIGKKLKELNQVFNCHLYKDIDGVYINNKKQDTILINDLKNLKTKVLAYKAIKELIDIPYDLTIGISKENSTKITDFIS